MLHRAGATVGGVSLPRQVPNGGAAATVTFHTASVKPVPMSMFLGSPVPRVKYILEV